MRLGRKAAQTHQISAFFHTTEGRTLPVLGEEMGRGMGEA